MKRRTKILLGLAVLIVAVIVFGVAWSRRDKDVTAVTMAKVARVDLTSKVSANGKIDAQRKVDLSANIMGQIVNLAVREGDRVKKGDFLLQIDKNQAAAGEAGSVAALAASLSDRDSARATMEQARRDYERAKKNFEANILSEADYQKAKSAFDTATATFQASQNRIQHAIRPFDLVARQPLHLLNQRITVAFPF